jgi:hypothetical protein
MMNNINIEIPQEVICSKKHEAINFDILEGKIILSLMGFAKSGKDSITKIFVDDYGYQRIAFADNIKEEMNVYLKEIVYKDICKGDVPICFELKEVDFFTENKNIKPYLRPYIIWYGEKLRTINGKFCWINKAFENGKDMDKIILSDVRRLPELDLFKNSNEFNKRYVNSMSTVGVIPNITMTNDYNALLFEVNQFNLTDIDALTVETIQTAREQWLINDTFYIDSRIPENGSYRQRAIEVQIERIAKKFGIDNKV